MLKGQSLPKKNQDQEKVLPQLRADLKFSCKEAGGMKRYQNFVPLSFYLSSSLRKNTGKGADLISLLFAFVQMKN